MAKMPMTQPKPAPGAKPGMQAQPPMPDLKRMPPAPSFKKGAMTIGQVAQMSRGKHKPSKK